MGCVSSGTGDRLGALESSERVAHGATRAQRGTSARWVERMATGREVLQEVLTPPPCARLQLLAAAKADTPAASRRPGQSRHGPHGRVWPTRAIREVWQFHGSLRRSRMWQRGEGARAAGSEGKVCKSQNGPWLVRRGRMRPSEVHTQRQYRDS